MRIRGHNLLCVLGFVGKGYSPGFVANMRMVVGSLGEAAEVLVVDGPDAICAACPKLGTGGCALHGEDTEPAIVAQDHEVMDRLGIGVGEAVLWGEIRERIRDQVAPDDLDTICGACPWASLGHCKDGLRRLRAQP